MYPGPDDPDLGVFVAQMERALRERGHEIELAVLDRARRRQAPLRSSSRGASARRRKPDVVYAHFLVPAGLIALARRRAARRHRARPGRPQHRHDPRRRSAHPPRRRSRAAVIAVSEYLRRELEAKLPARARQDRGRRLGRRPRALLAEPRDEVSTGLAGVSSASVRSPSARTSSGSPTRSRGSGRGASRSSATDRCARSSKDASACVSSGACRTTRCRLDRGRRRRLPAEPDRAVRPVAARGDGLRPHGRRDADRRPARVRPARRRRPRRPDRRRRARHGAPRARPRFRGRTRPPAPQRRSTTSGVRLSGSRRFSSEPSRSASLSSTSGRTCSSSPASRADLERLQERLPRLLRVDALLEPVVAGYEQFLDLFASIFVPIFHNSLVRICENRLWPKHPRPDRR